MALVKQGGGFLHKRSLKKVLGKQAANVDWNDKELMLKIDTEINKIVKVGAKGVGALAKSMVPVESGNLRSSENPYRFSDTLTKSRSLFFGFFKRGTCPVFPIYYDLDCSIITH